MKLAAFLTVIIVAILPGFAELRAQPAGTLLLTAHGSCKRFTVSSTSYACDKVLYTELPNARFGYTLTVPGGVMTLFGGKTSQPVPEQYTLVVDKIVTTFHQSNQTVDLPANGNCVLKLSADGTIFHELNCDVKGDVDRVVIKFLGDGRPVRATRL